MLPDLDWLRLSQRCLRAAEQAAELIQVAPSDLTISKKTSFKDLVTDKDIEVQEAISRSLADTGKCVVGEENFLGLPREDVFWCVDPIDGTTNFTKGVPFYGTSIGLVVEGSPKIGALAFPQLGEIYFTKGAESSYLNGRILKVHNHPLSSGLVGYAFAGGPSDELARERSFRMFRQVHERSLGCLRLGSAAALLAYVASGRCCAAIGTGARLWDVAGGIALCKAAGAHVDLRRHEDPSVVDFIVGSADSVASLQDIREDVK